MLSVPSCYKGYFRLRHGSQVQCNLAYPNLCSGSYKWPNIEQTWSTAAWTREFSGRSSKSHSGSESWWYFQCVHWTGTKGLQYPITPKLKKPRRLYVRRGGDTLSTPLGWLMQAVRVELLPKNNKNNLKNPVKQLKNKTDKKVTFCFFPINISLLSLLQLTTCELRCESLFPPLTHNVLLNGWMKDWMSEDIWYSAVCCHYPSWVDWATSFLDKTYSTEH